MIIWWDKEKKKEGKKMAVTLDIESELLCYQYRISGKYINIPKLTIGNNNNKTKPTMIKTRTIIKIFVEFILIVYIVAKNK